MSGAGWLLEIVGGGVGGQAFEGGSVGTILVEPYSFKVEVVKPY